MARDALAPLAPGVPEKRRTLFALSPIKPNPSKQELSIERPVITPKVSSTALRTIGDENRKQRRRRRNVAQQDRVWQEKCYEGPLLVAELGYMLNLQASVTALCDFPVRRWNEENGRWEANDREDEEAEFDERPEAVMEALVGPNGGRAEVIRKAAYHLFCAGESHLVGTPIESGTGIMWEFLSVLEVYPDADGRLVRRRSGMTSEDVDYLGDDVYVARLLNSSPIYSDLAECEVRRVLPIIAEIASLTQMVDATIKSRIPANILFIPEGMTLHGVGDTDDAESLASDGPPGTLYDIDQLVEEIYEHVNQSQMDPLSAARLVPLVLVGRGEEGQYIRVIELSRELDGWAQDLRQEALVRLARGLDAPPELMSGRANTNHWTSAIIDQDFLVKHIQPVGQLIADFLTESYLRPMLTTFEGMDEDEAFQWKVVFDPSNVTARADEAKSARDLRDLLSDEAILAANGFDKADQVSEESKTERRVWQLISTNPTLFAPLLLQLKGFEDWDLNEVLELITATATAQAAVGVNETIVEDGELVDPLPGTQAAQRNEDVAVEDGGTDETTGAETPERPEGLAALTEALLTEADMAVDRALSKAGSRIVSHLQGADDTLRARAKSAPKQQLAATLSRADLSALGTSPSKLLRGAFDEFKETAGLLTFSYLQADNVGEVAAQELSNRVADALTSRVQAFITERFHEKIRRHDNGHRVPTSLVLGVLEDVIPISV